jgi:hypothetical protein
MRKFIINLILFFTFIAVFAYSLDYIISQGLRTANLRKYQAWNDIFSSNIKGNLLIMGSSRAWAQYNPKILDSIDYVNSYNIGIDGHPFDYQLIRYKTYRRFNQKPRFIIQNIDFGTLALTDSGYEREQFFPYTFDDTLMLQVSKVKDISWLYRNIPLIRYYGYRDIFETGIKSFLGEKNFFDGGMYKGYRGNNYPWDGSKLKKIDKVFFAKDSIAVKMFDTYLAQCKAEDINVILVSAPVYIEATKKIIDEKEMRKMFSDFALKYNLKLLDYTRDAICYDTAYFYNATHLNKKGSELFSTKLANDIKLYLKPISKK